MKKYILISALLAIVAGYDLISCRQKKILPEKAIANRLINQTNSFLIICKNLQVAAQIKATDENQLQQLFLETRLAYKNFEWAAEYFEPATSRFVNGPPVEEVEFNGQTFEPAGLQVIESILFPKYDTTRKQELIKQMNLLQLRCAKYKVHFGNIDIFNWQVFDAAKLEIFRIETLGIAGFDDPITLRSMIESAASLQSLQKVLTWYPDTMYSKNLMDQFDKAIQYLSGNTDFDSFDRLKFIKDYANPLTTTLTLLEEKLKIPAIRYNRLLNQDAKTLFDTNAFNVNAYAPDPSSFISAKKTMLGKILFADPILSGTGTRSCQSCHQPEKAFTDGLPENRTIDNSQLLARNTPTLINAALQPSQFYDLRVNTLEDQSRNVVQNILEMHGSMELSVKKLWENKVYRQMFADAFPKENRTEIDTLEVMNALGSYIRTLTMLNSRFDEFMRGNNIALNSREMSGFNLFMGKARCATCHYMPLFNGNFPPRYMKIESEVIGVPKSIANKEIDSDAGRFNIVKANSYKHAFKVPTLRNAARTAPYMHNGVFTTLEQVVDFYNKGGGNGTGLNIDNQTLAPDKLQLTRAEQEDLIAFIKSLDSK